MNKACVLVFGLWSLAATAQVPVVEAGGSSRGQNAAQPASNDLIVTLYNQLEALQQEVQTLRGIVEEQTNQIRRMQTEQRDRYLDLDRRLSTLGPGGALGTTTPDVSSPLTGSASLPSVSGSDLTVPAVRNPSGMTLPPATDIPGQTTTIPEPAAPAVSSVTGPDTSQMDEQTLYRTALDLLLEKSQYEESIRLFQSYIDTYPQGRLLTNAYYWQGEALILVSRFSQARDVFTKVISNYPQDPKAAGAMLKLGVAYKEMGNQDLAVQTWREIATRYPENVSEIRAAQDYLNNQ